jgi:hypothetical protein
MLTPILQLSNSKYYINNFDAIREIVKRDITTLAFKKRIGNNWVYTGSDGSTICFVMKRSRRAKKLPRNTIWLEYKKVVPKIFKDSDTIHLQFKLVDPDMNIVHRDVDSLKAKYKQKQQQQEKQGEQSKQEQSKDKTKETPTVTPTFPAFMKPTVSSMPSTAITPPTQPIKTISDFIDIGDANAVYRRQEKKRLLKDASTGITTKKGNLLVYDVVPPEPRAITDQGVGTDTPIQPLPPLLQNDDDTLDLDEVKVEIQTTPRPRRHRRSNYQTPKESKDVFIQEKLYDILCNIKPFPKEIYNFFPLFYFLCNDFHGPDTHKENLDNPDNWAQKESLPSSLIAKAMLCQRPNGTGNYSKQFEDFNKFLLARHVVMSLRHRTTKESAQILQNYGTMLEMRHPNPHKPVYYTEFLLPILKDLESYYNSVVPFGKEGRELWKRNINKEDVTIHTVASYKLLWTIPWGGDVYQQDMDNFNNFKNRLSEEIRAAKITGGPRALNIFQNTQTSSRKRK